MYPMGIVWRIWKGAKPLGHQDVRNPIGVKVVQEKRGKSIYIGGERVERHFVGPKNFATFPIDGN